MTGEGAAPTSSTLPTLLGAWGVSMATQSVADENYATDVNTKMGMTRAIPILTIPQDGMPQKDNVITKNLASLTFYLPGGFTKTGGSGVSINSLVKTSPKAGLVDPESASRLDQAMTRKFHGTQAYDLVLHLSGSFKSAFPKGKPGAEDAEKKKEEKPAEGEKKEEKKEDKPAHLVEATKPGNVILISDIDAFCDQFAYRIQRMGGMQMAQPSNGNSSLLLNIIDQAASSTHLIGARSRAAVARPFTKIKELEAAFDHSYGATRDKKQAELDKVSEEINQLVQQRQKNDKVYLDKDLEAKIKEGKAKMAAASKELRDLEKGLQRDKDKLAGNATLLNIAGMPLLVILFGIGMLVKRRTSTRAR
jgi:ABC-type uncharacterized transport system involved in gliding motility auxiliary subunit